MNKYLVSVLHGSLSHFGAVKCVGYGDGEESSEVELRWRLRRLEQCLQLPLCLASYPIHDKLKKKHLLFHTVSEGQKFGSSLAGWF